MKALTQRSRDILTTIESEEEHLMSEFRNNAMRLSDIDNRPSISAGRDSKMGASLETRTTGSENLIADQHDAPVETYRTYKRRWFGLGQLMLLNLVISWDWLTFAAVSTTSAEYFKVSENAINWLSNAFLFAFCFAAPAVLMILHRGPKPAIVAASLFVLAGNWIRYAGAKTASFPALMLGQIIIGFAQPCVLNAPTTYSDLWFTERGRTTATAVATLANPLGGALGQLLSPIWVSKKPEMISNMVLYVAVISSVASLPSFFIPARPPTPASASSSVMKPSIMKSIAQLFRNVSFWLIFLPFATYVGFFNATSSLINQIYYPYAFTEDQAGIGGALLIIVGIIASIITSIIIDRTHAYKWTIKILIPITAVAFLALVFTPPTRALPAPYTILALLGASSFSLLPVALEYVVELTFPVGPETSSVVLWTGGQFLGAIFTIIMASLKDEKGSTDVNGDRPPGNLQRSLVFQAVLCCVVAVLPMMLGWKKLGLAQEDKKRMVVDSHHRTPAMLG